MISSGKYNRMPELETERLILRRIQKEDTDAIFECWMRDEDVSRYMFWKASDDRKEAEEFVTFELENQSNSQWNRWLIETKDSKTIVGTCLIFYNDEEGHWDISYNLGKKYWGKGFITEAMQTVMRYAKEKLNMTYCETTCARENVASAHVLEKLGFVFREYAPYECNGGTIKTTGKRYVWSR
ncbi:MAG: GNAT family N-acetyltransferase [Lachnospiraceae bacterium]|nr:GNAT family N-acetyltransferase [Lachnospiraceae bacterium]